MGTMVRINEDNYIAIKKMADEDGRSVTNMTNRLLDRVIGRDSEGTPTENTPLPKNTEPINLEKIKSEATPPTSSVADLFAAPPYDPEVAAKQLSGELPCCLNELQPCKHWVWDVNSGDGYKNSLSGRLMEVE